MTSTSSPGVGHVVDEGAPPILTGAARFRRRFRQQRVALVALAYVVVLVVVAVFAGVLTRHDPLAQDLRDTFAGPSRDHWLGTDELGRDTLTRLVFATRIALVAAVQGVATAVAIGVPLGLFVGYRGGWWDRVVMRLVDTVIALPSLIVSIAILAALGPGLTNAMLALGLMLSTSFVRLTRGLVLSAREQLFVDAARVTGVSTPRIMVRHLLPSVGPALIVQTTLACSTILLAEAGLSFLGLGVQPPDASWGAMLSTAVKFINQSAFLVIPPGVMIMLTVLAFNLLGDGIRDALGHGRVLGAARPRARGGPAAVADVPSRPVDGRPSDETTPLLSIVGLSVAFPGRDDRVDLVLDDVSFDISPGEVVGLVGESGCGKSMTAMAVMGLVPAPGSVVAGSIELDGRELVGLDEPSLARVRGKEIATIFQEPMTSLNPAFTVADQIGEVLRVHMGMGRRARRQRTTELLDLVGIADAARRMRDHPHQMSGGMAQRVMIAMALAGEPRLLVADEPTTALDVTIQDQVIELLRDVQRELGMAVLFVTHDLGVVADICDRVVVMYAGQVIETASADELFDSPRHPYTSALLSSMPQNQPRAGELVQIPGRVPPAWAWPAGCRFRPRCAHATHRCEVAPQLERVGGRTVRCVRVGELDPTASPVEVRR